MNIITNLIARRIENNNDKHNTAQSKFYSDAAKIQATANGIAYNPNSVFHKTV